MACDLLPLNKLFFWTGNTWKMGQSDHPVRWRKGMQHLRSGLSEVVQLRLQGWGSRALSAQWCSATVSDVVKCLNQIYSCIRNIFASIAYFYRMVFLFYHHYSAMRHGKPKSEHFFAGLKLTQTGLS